MATSFTYPQPSWSPRFLYNPNIQSFTVIRIFLLHQKMEPTKISKTSSANLIHTSCENPKTKKNINLVAIRSIQFRHKISRKRLGKSALVV